ncbi:AAA family ATPase [Streptomyces sp. NPDC002602]|uniref:AAA family ATPase n=1 Tax=Streptomyces sp. NPDC002602 TaxID=3364654 RepID=UPI0036BF9C43
MSSTGWEVGHQSDRAPDPTPPPLPAVYLFVGLTGAGRTTYSRRVLEPAGAVGLSVDEVVHQRHGRYGVDYPEATYFAKEGPVVAELQGQLVRLVAEGRDVVWDHGLWSRQDRDEMKRLVHDAGGRWRLLYFPADRTEPLAAQGAESARRRERADGHSGGSGRLHRPSSGASRGGRGDHGPELELISHGPCRV